MKVSLSIDDLSSCPDTKVEHCINLCDKILQIYPDAKFNLFVSTAYFRTFDGHKSPYYLRYNENVVKLLKNLDDNSFRICYHGHFHGIPFVSNNDEFRRCSYNEAMKSFVLSKKEFDICGLNCYNILRPPAFHIGEEAVRAAIDFGIKHISLYEIFKQRKEYDRILNKFDNDLFSFVNCAPSAVDLKMYDRLFVMYHALINDRNFMSEKLVYDLIVFLNNCGDVEFKFLEEMF